jgi:hypothetical protein
MKELLKQLLNEDSQVSMTRLMSLICIVSAAGMAFYGLQKGCDLVALSMLSGAFLAAGFGGKVGQKAIEMRSKT